MDLRQLLEEKYRFYNSHDFIEKDPVCIPHKFVKKEDIEISGFLTALISWGNRKLIIDSATSLMNLMNNSPFDYVQHADATDLKTLSGFYYRTLNSDDLLFLVQALKNTYRDFGGLEEVAVKGFREKGNVKGAIIQLRDTLLRVPHLSRSEKHLANPERGSAAKRINMFLRWMVRKDDTGVDFGLWNGIPQRELMCPLDVHSGRIARKLGLLERKQNDWKAVEELTARLKALDPEDPVKYDYALFGMGVFEGKPV